MDDVIVTLIVFNSTVMMLYFYVSAISYSIIVVQRN